MALIDRVAKIAPRQSLTVIPGSALSADAGSLPKPTPYAEVGVTGLLRTKGVGYVYDDFLPQLSTYRQKMVYREMRDNDAVIGAMFFALEMILRRAEWRVEPADHKDGEKAAQFVKDCQEDMSHTWEDFIAECVNMFAFGFALFETVYKRRKGPNGKKPSRFNDGKVGWRKFAPRAAESIWYWIWDDEGGLQGAVQLAAPDYHTVTIPIESLMLFRTTSVKNSPEGRSILRNVFRSWFFKKRIEEIEGIGIERDLCGIPVLKCSAEALKAMGGEDAAKKIVTNIRRDDQMGVVLPLAYDEKGNELVKLELLQGAGQRQANPSETIQRYNQDMLNTILAGFIQLGQTPTGSRSLHMSASQIFSTAITAFMDSVAAVVNRIAIPRLFALNSMDLDSCPKLVPGEIGSRDLDELGNYVRNVAMGGVMMTDKPAQDYLRKAARMPEAPDEPELQGMTANPLATGHAESQATPVAPGQGLPTPKPNGALKPAPTAPKGKPNGSAADGAAGGDKLEGVA